MRLNPLAQRHPYRFVAILEGMVVLVYLLTGTAAYFLDLSNMSMYGLANLALTIIVIALLTTTRTWKTTGFRSSKRSSDLLYYLVPLLPVALNWIPGIRIDSLRDVSIVLAVTLMVGFAEEVIFRGLMLQAMKPLGYWRAAIITALLFGLTHAMNALAGKSAFESAMQIGYAFAIGFGYAALALKKEMLWPLVLTHFLTDFVFFIQKPGFALPPFWQTWIVIGLGLVFMVYGVVLLAGKNHPTHALTGPADQGVSFASQ